MKKAIVTGATGFIGSWLVVYLLKNNVKVYALVRNENKLDAKVKSNPNLSVIPCDLSDAGRIINLIPEEEIDVFYHLAWEGASGVGRREYSIQLGNIISSMECIAAAEKMKIKKFVTVGTIGENLADLALEDNIISENYVYALSKSYLHRLLKITSSKLNINLVWCTLSGIYGKGDKTTNLVNYTIKALIKGEVPEYGPGTQLFDFLHVEDCVRALYFIGDKENAYDNYYIGSGSPRMLKDYLLCIRDCFGNGAEIRLGARPDDGTRYMPEWFDTNNLVNDIHFQPEITFEAGILRLIRFFKDNN